MAGWWRKQHFCPLGVKTGGVGCALLDSMVGDRLDKSDYDVIQTVFYTTSPTGEIIEVENADTIIKITLKYVFALMDAMNQIMAKEVREYIESLYTKETLLSLDYKEILHLHTPLGYAWSLNKPIKSKAKVDNPKFLMSFGMPKNELKNYNMLMVDEGIYEYRAYPGIPLHIDVSRGTIIYSDSETTGKMERYIITLEE